MNEQLVHELDLRIKELEAQLARARQVLINGGRTDEQCDEIILGKDGARCDP